MLGSFLQERHRLYFLEHDSLTLKCYMSVNEIKLKEIGNSLRSIIWDYSTRCPFMYAVYLHCL